MPKRLNMRTFCYLIDIKEKLIMVDQITRENKPVAKSTKPTWFIDGKNRGEPTYRFKHLGHIGTVVRGDGYYVAKLDSSGELDIESVAEAKRMVETWLENLVKARIETAQAWLSQYTTANVEPIQSPINTDEVAVPVSARKFTGFIST